MTKLDIFINFLVICVKPYIHPYVYMLVHIIKYTTKTEEKLQCLKTSVASGITATVLSYIYTLSYIHMYECTCPYRRTYV